MYCEKCGRKISDNALYSEHCGCLVTTHEKTNNVEIDTTPDTNQSNETNSIAIVGFIFSFVSPLLGWILGGIGISRANKRGGKGKGFATAAIVISTILAVFNLLSL